MIARAALLGLLFSTPLLAHAAPGTLAFLFGGFSFLFLCPLLDSKLFPWIAGRQSGNPLFHFLAAAGAVYLFVLSETVAAPLVIYWLLSSADIIIQHRGDLLRVLGAKLASIIGSVCLSYPIGWLLEWWIV
jgi:hypothetical protein